MKTNTSPCGMTMIELIIAVAVFSLVISMSFIITVHTTRSFGQQIQEGTLVDKGEKVLKSMEEELGDASLRSSTGSDVFDVTTNSMTFRQAAIQYMVPLRYATGNTGNNPNGYAVTINKVLVQTDPVSGMKLNSPTFPDDGAGGGDFDFRLCYGWRDNARYIGNLNDSDKMVQLQGPGLKPGSGSLPSGVVAATSSFTVNYVTYPSGTLKGGYMCYRFQPDNTLRVGKYGANGLLSEADENIDIDGDGNMTGTYVVGYLERCYFVGDPGNEQLVPESSQRIADGVMLQPTPGTFDAAGPADQLKSNRIFNRDPDNPARLNIFIWMFSMDGEGQPHMVQSKVSIFMRNNATYVTSSSATGTN